MLANLRNTSCSSLLNRILILFFIFSLSCTISCTRENLTTGEELLSLQEDPSEDQNEETSLVDDTPEELPEVEEPPVEDDDVVEDVVDEETSATLVDTVIQLIKDFTGGLIDLNIFVDTLRGILSLVGLEFLVDSIIDIIDFTDILGLNEILKNLLPGMLGVQGVNMVNAIGVHKPASKVECSNTPKLCSFICHVDESGEEATYFIPTAEAIRHLYKYKEASAGGC